MSQSEGWSNYWEHESSKGEVFVDKSGNKHPKLAEFWQNEFSSYKPNDRIIDLASGAGSIFNSVNHQIFSKLFAVDFSDVALKRLQKDIPQAQIQIGSCDKLPTPDACFDHVLSQFGIEYSTEDGFYEALRILDSAGDFTALVHYKGGYIDDRNTSELKGVSMLIDNLFVDLVMKIANAFKSKDTAIIESSIEQFSLIEPMAHTYCDKHKAGLPAHCYNGCKRLLQDYSKYDHHEVITWLENIKLELTETHARLSNMISVAFSEERMMDMTNNLRKKGASSVSVEPLLLAGHDKPIAWILKFQKEV